MQRWVLKCVRCEKGVCESEKSVYCIHTLESVAVSAYLRYFSQSLLLYPQLQLMTSTTAERFIYGAFSRLHASLFKERKRKIKTPAINKPKRIIWHWLLYMLSLPLLFFLSPLLSSPKHSYLDRETSLILKSIAGKPSHLLTKVTSSNTRWSLCVCVCVCVCAVLLFCSACLSLEKSIFLENSCLQFDWWFIYFSPWSDEDQICCLISTNEEKYDDELKWAI